MFLGNSLVLGGITGLVDGFRATRTEARIMLSRVRHPSAFGVAELDSSARVVPLIEKPSQPPPSDLVLAGIYIFGSAIYEAARANRHCWRGEVTISQAIQWLIDHANDARPAAIPRFWKGTGHVADMLEVNRLALEDLEPIVRGSGDEASEIIGKLRIEEGAQAIGSRSVGTAIVGTNTVIPGSCIGSYRSVSENCRVEDSEIEYSIMPPGPSLPGYGGELSLIGRGVEVTPAPRSPAAHRLMLGETASLSPAHCASCAARSPTRLFPPGRLIRAIKATHTELLERPLPPRRRRTNLRVIKRKVARCPQPRRPPSIYGSSKLGGVRCPSSKSGADADALPTRSGRPATASCVTAKTSPTSSSNGCGTRSWTKDRSDNDSSPPGSPRRACAPCSRWPAPALTANKSATPDGSSSPGARTATSPRSPNSPPPSTAGGVPQRRESAATDTVRYHPASPRTPLPRLTSKTPIYSGRPPSLVPQTESIKTSKP
jgi:hypothetical protein